MKQTPAELTEWNRYARLLRWQFKRYKMTSCVPETMEIASAILDSADRRTGDMTRALVESRPEAGDHVRALLQDLGRLLDALDRDRTLKGRRGPRSRVRVPDFRIPSTVIELREAYASGKLP